MRIYSFLFIWCLITGFVNAQVQLNTDVTPEITVCEGSGKLEVEIINATSLPLSSTMARVKLATGMKYISGSLGSSNSSSIQEYDVSSDTPLQFSLNTIAQGDTVSFHISYAASVSAIAAQQNGSVFRNQIQLQHSSDTTTATTSSYNILYPVLAVISVNPNQSTIVSGTSTTRTIKLVNGGNGRLSAAYVVDKLSDTAVSIDSVDIGFVVGDSIMLTSSDFKNWGNGDTFWDQNEIIEIREYLYGASCNDITVSSEFRVYWGCENEKASSASAAANLSIDFEEPKLNISSEDQLNTCFQSGSAHGQQLMLVNNGNGVASSPSITIYKASGTTEDQSIYSRIDDSSLVYRIGLTGPLVQITNTTTTLTSVTGAYSCLGSSPTGKVQFNVPNIAPTDTFYIFWDMYSCCVESCNNQAISGWAAKVTYKNVCGNQTYNLTHGGQGINKQYMTISSETPTDITAGQKQVYTYIVSSFENTLPAGTGAHYALELDLPEGLVFDSLSFQSNSVQWPITSLVHDTVRNNVTAQFNVNAPFIIPKSEIQVVLEGKCGSQGWKSIDFSFSYVADTSCTASCAVPLVCNYITTTYLHCPLNNCSGIRITDYSLQRINFGAPDNDLDGKPDLAGSIDFTKIKRNRAMVGDTIRSVVKSIIQGNSTTYGYASYSSNIDYGSCLKLHRAQFSFYDSSTGLTHIINDVPGVKTTSGNAGNFSYNLSIGALAAIDSSVFGLHYEHGDSLSLMIDYVVHESVTGLIKETTFLNDLYVSSVSSPGSGQKKQCNFRNGRLTLIGYNWRNDSRNRFALKTCSRYIHQYFGMSIGSLGNNYAGGNLFPYEYRNFGIPAQVKVKIPDGYYHTNSKLFYYRTKKTNSIVSSQISNITPDTIIGDTLYFDLYKYFQSGELLPGDDGFHGRILVGLGAECTRQKNVFEDIEWYFDYKRNNQLGGSQSGFIGGIHDQIKYQPAAIELSSPNPIQNAETRLIHWDLKVKNTTSSTAANTWVMFQPPPGMTIDSVVQTSNQEKIIEQNGFYQLGQLNAYKSSNVTIYASINACSPDELHVIAGSSCDGYPTNLSTYDCGTTKTQLSFIPRVSAFQGRISSELMNDPCSPQVKLKVDVTSVNLANVFDMNVRFSTSDTLKIDMKDSAIEYVRKNQTKSLVRPVLSGDAYSFALNNIDTTLVKTGLPGVLGIPENTYTLNTTLEMGPAYEPGDYLAIKIQGNNLCADTLPDLNLALDLNSKFERNETAGLNLEIGNSWSASWGDYDNDGYDDLFVPINDLSKPNILYHNNKDGTFSKVTTGDIVTDKGASIAGVWGDYDNDGYLDLFVANNVNSENKLYHNNGNGTFTSITNSPIVNEGIYSHAAAWADYDRDGNLDLVVSDFHPTHFNFLFKGDGKGGFEVDTKSEVGLSASSAVGVAWGDYDNDGDQDLFIANTNGENNQLFRNEEGVLRKVTTGTVVTDSGYSVGGAWGDYDNDGDLDLFVTNARITEPNLFYENNGDGTFKKITNTEIVSHVSSSHGASWADYDNDGYLDLIVANDQNQANFLFRNNGDKTFTSIHNAITQEYGDAYGTAWSDYDNDGDYDLVVANRGDNTNDFFVNSKGSCTNHLVVDLIGCKSNRSGIGAQIKVKSLLNGVPKWQTKEVATQNSAMGGQNSSKILFGLGKSTQVDSLVVLWPSGLTTTLLNPGVNSVQTVNEPCGAQVCGDVFYDANANQVRDSGETGIPYAQLMVSPQNIRVYTDANGHYAFYSGDDTITVTQVQRDGWIQTHPASSSGHTIVVNSLVSSTYCGFDFADSATCVSPDFTIQMGGAAMRRGLLNKLQVQLTNEGVGHSTDSVQVEIEASLNFWLTGSTWTSVSEDSSSRTYVYSLPEIKAMSDTLLQLIDSIDVGASLNDTVHLTARVVYNDPECDTLNNSYALSDIIVGSIDPNDKHVYVDQCELLKETEIDKPITERLQYKIRFQNLGNYAARRVEIHDQLSSDLDWNTFRIESSSHPFTVSMSAGKVIWINEEIELPDSATNEEESNGFVAFSILPRTGVLPYTLINNSAQIQFDRNKFIKTNNTEAYVGLCAIKDNEYNLVVFPNPADRYTEVLLMDEDQKPIRINTVSLVDVRGAVVMHQEIHATRCVLNTENLDQGMYTVKVLSENGRTYTRKLILL